MEAAVATAVTALLAGLFRAWERRRVKGGSIRTSEAGELWDEAERERHYLRQELDHLRAEILRCRANNHDLRNEIILLQWGLKQPDLDDHTIERLVASNNKHIQHLREEAERLEAGSHRSRRTDEDG